MVEAIILMLLYYLYVLIAPCKEPCELSMHDSQFQKSYLNRNRPEDIIHKELIMSAVTTVK
jgi:hypothetical protein